MFALELIAAESGADLKEGILQPIALQQCPSYTGTILDNIKLSTTATNLHVVSDCLLYLCFLARAARNYKNKANNISDVFDLYETC
jgi:hypothetical protein